MKRSEPTDYSADELAKATRRLDMALADWHGELSERMEMGSAELMVLARLAMDDTIGPSELAHSLHVTTGAMTALLDRLAERGHWCASRTPRSPQGSPSPYPGGSRRGSHTAAADDRGDRRSRPDGFHPASGAPSGASSTI